MTRIPPHHDRSLPWLLLDEAATSLIVTVGMPISRRVGMVMWGLQSRRYAIRAELGRRKATRSEHVIRRNLLERGEWP